MPAVWTAGILGHGVIRLRPSIRSLRKHLGCEAHELEYFGSSRSTQWFSLGRDALGAAADWAASLRDGVVWLPAYRCREVFDPFVRRHVRTRSYDLGVGMSVDWERLLDVTRRMPGTHVLLFIDYLGFLQRIPPEVTAELQSVYTLVIRDTAAGLPHPESAIVAGSAGGCVLFSLRKSLGWPEGAMWHAGGGAPRLPEIGMAAGDWLRARGYLLHQLLASALAAEASHVAQVTAARLKHRRSYGVSPAPPTRWILERVDLDGVRRARQRNAARLLDVLRPHAAYGSIGPGDCPYYLPLRVSQPAALAQRLQAEGIESTRYWGVERGSTDGDFPNASALAEQMVCVPTHHGLAPDAVERIAAAATAALK